uniref:Uncharacterized protein n=1 Tax=Oryza brachyantha TaxID=4533 RepID=J3NCY7_ORYBR
MSITEDAAIRINYTLIRGVQQYPHEMNKDQKLHTPSGADITLNLYNRLVTLRDL